MTGPRAQITLELSVELLEAIVERASEIASERIVRNAADDGPRWATLEEAAAYFRTTPAALRKRAQRGTLAGAVKDEGRWLIDLREFDASLVRLAAQRTLARAATTASPPAQEE